MNWQYIKENKIVLFIKQKKAHFLFPILTGALGGWLGMLLTPVIGAIFIAISIYLTLVIFVPWNKIPWNKLKVCRDYLIPAIICLLIVWPLWDRVITIFPSNDPYKQLLLIGTANISVTVEPNGEIGKGLKRFGLATISLVKGEIKEKNIMLQMSGWAGCDQTENGQAGCGVKAELSATDNSVNRPIYRLAEADYAVIWFEKLPPQSEVVDGNVIFTFNSSVHIEIPIPPQIMEENAIIIPEVQKYFKKGN